MLQHSNDSFDEIINCIINEGVCLLQTDTVFGLICRGDSDKATNRIINIKQRKHNAFGYFVKNMKMAKKYVKIETEMQNNLFRRAFPGYFTLIFEATDVAINTLPEVGFGMNKNGKKTLGIRIPKNDFSLSLLNDDRIKFPILATSANITRHMSPTKFDEIDDEIIKNVDIIYYDDNCLMANRGSTIIDLSSDNIEIVRLGSGLLDIIDIKQ